MSSTASEATITNSDYSDVEQIGSNNEFASTLDGEEGMSVNLGLGEAWFKYHVYKQLSANPIYQAFHIDIEAASKHIMTDFAYSSAYNMLQVHVDRVFGVDLREQFAEGREAYLVALGIVDRAGSQTARQKALDSLRHGMGEIVGSSNPPPYSSTTLSRTAISKRFSASRGQPSASELAQRSKALNEYCQRHGLSARYDAPVTESIEPPLTSMTVWVGGRSWTGHATNKKVAKLNAAYRASVGMRLAIPNGGL